MKKELVKLANHLDRIGLRKEANYVDALLKKEADDPALPPISFTRRTSRGEAPFIFGFIKSEEEEEQVMKSIDWNKCGLPDAESWNGYSQKSLEFSKSKKETGGDSEVSKQQFVGAVTVPLRWHALATFGKDIKKMLSRLEVDGAFWPYDSTYKSYVDFYITRAKGTKIHSYEFNHIFMEELLKAVRETLKTSQYMGLGENEEKQEEIILEIRRRFIDEIHKTPNNAECLKSMHPELIKLFDVT